MSEADAFIRAVVEIVSKRGVVLASSMVEQDFYFDRVDGASFDTKVTSAIYRVMTEARDENVRAKIIDAMNGSDRQALYAMLNGLHKYQRDERREDDDEY